MNVKIISMLALVLSIINIIAILTIATPLANAGIITLGKPSGCNYDGSCQGWESSTCPDCTGGGTTTTTIVSEDCGDGYCAGKDLGEDCKTCPADCPGITSGKLSNRYCCGNYGCEIVGEDSNNCPVDCGAPPTTTTTPPTTTTTIPDSCTDTDGGWEPFVKGTVSGYLNEEPYSYTDYCFDNQTLNEYYCSGGRPYSGLSHCGNVTTSCSNGVCV